MSPPSVLELAHHVIRDAVPPGSLVVDATVGNGHDTLVLAERVGDDGLVVGFDVQLTALEATRQRLKAAGMLHRVRLIREGHEHVHQILRVIRGRQLHAAMYNLGYLPGSDMKVLTKPQTTVASLQDVTRILAPGGVVTVVVYRGHKGGREESEAVLEWCRSLAPENFLVFEYRTVNRPHVSPHLLMITKKTHSDAP